MRIIQSAERRGYNTYFRVSQYDWRRVVRVRTNREITEVYCLPAGEWLRCLAISQLDNR